MPIHTEHRLPSAASSVASRWWTAVAVFAIAVMMAVVPSGGGAKAANGLANLPAVQPAMACSDIANLNLNGVVDGTVTITSATVQPAGATVGARAYALTSESCVVLGTIGPGTNQFVLVLPTTNWTQRYVQAGCGSLCGSLYIAPPEVSGCAPVANGQVAVGSTDMGHEGNYLPNSTTPWEADP